MTLPTPADDRGTRPLPQAPGALAVPGATVPAAAPRYHFKHKLVALTMLVVLAAQLATFFAVHVATQRSVAGQLEEELQVGDRVWTRFYERRGEQLLDNAAVLVDDFGFKAAVATNDLPTMRSALGNQAARLNADAAVLLAADGAWRTGLVEVGGPAQAAALAPLLERARKDGQATGVVLLDGRPYRVALLPVLAPDLIGWVAIGGEFGDAFLSDFQAVTSLDASVLRVGAGGRVLGSSLEGVQRKALGDLLPRFAPAAPGGGPGAPTASGTGTRVAVLDLAGTEFHTHSEALEPGVNNGLVLVLQRSFDQAMAPFEALEKRILILSALAALLALLAASFAARGVSRPIERLVLAARRIEAGDYTHAVAVRGNDEIASLGNALGRMQSEIAAREERILHQASHDTLTGLPNRASARDGLEAAIRRPRGDGPGFAVLAIDLHRFKEINDTLGHHFADQVLQQLALRLRTGLRGGDLVARLGGDEFMVVAEGIEGDGAHAQAERLLEHLRRPLELAQTRIHLDASIGVAIYPTHGDDPQTLLRRADIALYDAKLAHQGVSIYQPGRDEVHLRRIRLMTDLRESIPQGELQLRFQPKVQVESGRVGHVEALLRWTHPALGSVAPEEFIPLAEHSGFIHELTRYVLDEALKQLAQWSRLGIDLGVAVNLSAMDLMDADLPEYVHDRLRRHGVRPQRLILELTESALMRDVDYAIRMLERLRAFGVRLSIDDFGTGYSSLAQLKRMPVDELKIDKSFVMNLEDGSDDAVIVRSTIELAHNMGLSVIAEGVENQVALALLRTYQCDGVQGYLFSPPLEPTELLAWMRARGESFGVIAE